MSLLWAFASSLFPDSFDPKKHVNDDEIEQHYPDLFGEDEDGHGWATNYLAHATEEDPEAGNHMVHGLYWTKEHVDPYDIDAYPHDPSDSRVRQARHGYATGAAVPPLLLVKRGEGPYHVADGHHRARAARGVVDTVPAFVAHSPYPDEPLPEGKH